MTKVEFKKASRPLSESSGKRLERSVAIERLERLERASAILSTNRKFLRIINRSRARAKKAGTISAGELRRRLGLAK